MEWIAGFFLFIFYTVIANMIVFIIWKLCITLFHRKNDIIFVYYGFKILVYLFAIPIIAVCLWAKKYYEGFVRANYFLASSIIRDVIKGFSILWLIGVIFSFLYYAMGSFQLHRIKRCSMICEKNKAEVFRQCCKELKIRKKVEIRQSFLVQVPFISGVIHPKLYLPVHKFEEEELKVVLTHELMHCKYRDVLLKKVLAFCVCIYWFNPLIWKLSDWIDQWSESNCDLACCDYLADKQLYFGVLMEYADAHNKPVSHLTSMLYEKGIQGRVRRMSRYKELKRKGRKAAILATAIVTLVGSVTAYAASSETADLYTQAVQATENARPELLANDANTTGNELPEYRTPFDGDYGEILNGPSTRGSNSGILDTYLDDERVSTYAFYATAGQHITITFTVSPAGKNIRAGIVDANGDLRYVYAGGTFSHTFNVEMNGYHRVFLQNYNPEIVYITGSYYTT